jgi:flagellin
MSRINTNVTSLIAQRVLQRNNIQVNTSLERLSTGLKINKGSDNPAGLIASENLRAEKVGLTQAIDNAERASNLIGTAEGGLSEVSSLLIEVQGLTNQAANTGGLSAEEVAANQLQVDSILNTINRIAQSTSFEGKKLLNGNYDYTTTTPTNATNVRVNAARLPDGGTVAVAVDVTTSAQTGHVGKVGAAADNITVEIAGNGGSEQLTFATGTTVAQMITAINSVKTATSISASLSGANLRMDSIKFGTSQFVSVNVISGTWATIGGTGGKDTGVDAVVKVNGAAATVDGLSVTFRNSNLDVDFTLTSAANITNGTASYTISSGGATFALGSKVTEGDKVAIGIASVSTAMLGDSTTGYLSTLGTGGGNALTGTNLVSAQKIIDKAIKQVSQLRGRLGAFQKFTIGSTVNSLGVAFENASAAESAIRDTNFAEETAQLTRSQILSQAATTVLAQANATPQNALALLRG